MERASGRSLASLLQEIVEAAGLEQSFHCACDKDFVPITSGGGFLCARDLARYGQLFVRRGVGVDGSVVGSGAFLDETRRPPAHAVAADTTHLSAPTAWCASAFSSDNATNMAAIAFGR